MKLLMLKGLPASGKSTFARDLASKGWVRVNKDELRDMMNDGHWSQNNEKVVVQARNVLIINALNHGKSVVVDDTNFAPVHRETLVMIAEQKGATFETKFFDTPIEECIKRDLKRPNSVGERVIRDMYNKFLKPVVVPPVIDSTLPWAILCDIDGTLADMTERLKQFGKPGAYKWDAVGMDGLHREVAFVLERMQHNCSDIQDDDPIRAPKVILLSGRDEVCRPETEEWLKKHNIKYDELHMRRSDHVDEKGNQVKDTVVKREMYEKFIAGKYNVEFVLDDRNQVVELWRDLGLKCFQVAEGNF